ncbi:MAG: hypothetical protein P8Y23_11280 [Candidatus Lokiarchaeota archaeon]
MKLDFNVYEGPDDIIRKADLQEFPAIIQRYFEFTKVVGNPKVYNLSMAFSGLFRLNPNQPWFKANTNQFNYIPTPTRLFLIRIKLYRIFSMSGKDIYKENKGFMVGRFMHIKEIFNESGPEFDIGEFTTFLNDLIIFCPSGLFTLKDNLEWTKIDETTVEIKLSNKVQSVKAKLYFEPSGKLINFKSKDRYFEENGIDGNKKYIQHEWSTPIDSYRKVGDYFLPYQARTIWHLTTEDFNYARFRLDNLQHNVSKGFFKVR